MPWFRFIEDARVTLRFKNGVCELTFANLGGEDGWAWVAQKKGKPRDQVVLRRGNVMALQRALTGEGFGVAAGGAEERIMRAAVRCGFAEELPEEERWRRKLLAARRGTQNRHFGRAASAGKSPP